MSSTTNPAGMLQPSTLWGVYNNLMFVIQQALAKVQTATLVQVQACSNDGGVSPVGTVDVLILVNQINSQGVPTPHVTMYSLPYLRFQGGANAVIMDPQPGDIGIAVFASRDITNVKSTKAQANPGSYRTHDFSDGLYLGGVLERSSEPISAIHGRWNYHCFARNHHLAGSEHCPKWSLESDRWYCYDGGDAYGYRGCDR